MSVLVLGGAGYIGSVTVERLVQSGHNVVVYDNLSCGHRDAVETNATFVQGDVGDVALLEETIRKHKVSAAMHFCAHAQVGESVDNPLKYYENNVSNSIALLGALLRLGVDRFIFSSTAATFGQPDAERIAEDTPQAPINPYGWSKLMLERILADCSKAHGLRSITLRYFNACGATERHGEDHTPETHLIPLVLDVAAGREKAIGIFGRDYSTPDGTCIRDYIHVSDLADAHVLALKALEGGAATTAYNLGNGHGTSVQEIVSAAEEVTGRRIAVVDQPRRAGDPSRLVASSDLIRERLGWRPKIPELRRIVESAWKWKLNHPDGYGDKPRTPADR
jgi:UDP-glucose 4-epimerase